MYDSIVLLISLCLSIATPLMLCWKQRSFLDMGDALAIAIAAVVILPPTVCGIGGFCFAAVLFVAIQLACLIGMAYWLTPGGTQLTVHEETATTMIATYERRT